ncbi:MAG: HD domain-containing protein [Phycisphaerae bacterium]|nr:HD domain-containing protein [Gemmatimonadaceae bacterium]
MPVIGYSDRINHAFAFAAKHHDQQVRKGTRLPYLTHPANVAVILTRYGRDEETVVAGILHDVVEGCVRDGWSTEKLEERIGSKFGNSVLNTAMSVAERRLDDEGIELSHDDRKVDYLARLSLATEDALWVSAAHNLHNINSILWDVRRTAFPETVWGRFAAGKTGTVQMYADISARLQEIGFEGAIAAELRSAIEELQVLSRT